MVLQHITINLSNTAIRRETLQGREYLVAPMAMLAEGVVDGSGGPILYEEKDCRKGAPLWNTKPVVVYHPEINGKGVSACEPSILEARQVGMVMNTRWDNGKLRAEAWLEESRLKKVDDRILDALETNKVLEISTGLLTDNEEKLGTHNDIPYTHIARNHRPDHLAILPDKIGAYSIADGGGLLQLNETARSSGIDPTQLFARQIDLLRRLIGNAMSHSNVHSALASGLRARNGIGDDTWIADVYENFFVFEDNGKLFRLPYTSGDAVEIGEGPPEEVVRVTEYRTPEGSFVGNTAQSSISQEKIMAKKEIVDGLIAHESTVWVEDDRDTLTALEETTLEKMAPVVKKEGEGEGKGNQPSTDPKTVPEPAANVAQAAPAGAQAGEGAAPAANTAKPQTMEQFVAAAPPEFRDVIINGVAAHEEAKAKHIETIVANKANQFSKEFLVTKPLAELQGLAAIAGAAEPATSGAPGTVPMFTGQSTPAGAAPVINEDDSEPLVMPTMNWDEKKTG